jgi:hypothetical protein
LTACRAFLFTDENILVKGKWYLLETVVVLDAASAKLVEALLHVQRIDVDIGADLAQEGLLKFVEKMVIDFLVTIRQLLLTRCSFG